MCIDSVVLMKCKFTRECSLRSVYYGVADWAFKPRLCLTSAFYHLGPAYLNSSLHI